MQEWCAMARLRRVYRLNLQSDLYLIYLVFLSGICPSLNDMAPGIADIPYTKPKSLQHHHHHHQYNDHNEHHHNNHIVSSPYSSPLHLLDLRTLDIPSQLLAQALTLLAPTRPDYATAPYHESFNWPTVFTHLHHLAQSINHPWTHHTFYVVVFRSILARDIDIDWLSTLDEESHREATHSGGLLKYWFGTTNAHRQNLATCLWRHRDDARAGGSGPWHQRARLAAAQLYERIEFQTMSLVVEQESWRLESL